MVNKNNLIDKLSNPNRTGDNPNEIARELRKFCDSDDEKGLKELFQAYYDGLKKISPYARWSANKLKNRAKSVFLDCARLSDIVVESGDEEASGQLTLLSSIPEARRLEIEGQITQFYREVIYNNY